jgi:hypothetical protein
VDFLAEVAAIDGRIGMANFARVLARCDEIGGPAAACPIGGCD